MDNLGSEVGHKMRSAVKAKLIELGSGTSAGYIDDELPDYVMIMVANKRSKDQMTEDLSLFLGKNTESFVSWLHQVLEKLQEVTLPSSTLQKNKRKASESNDKPDKNDKKDKKGKKKLKRSAKDKSPEKETERSTTPPLQSTSTASITDVFADHMLQKAKKSLDNVSTASIKTKSERPTTKDNNNSATSNDGFDIPTITEIAKNAVGEVVRRKEITELEELQKKINQAKRQLRQLTDESDDEDFINLRADRDDLTTDSTAAVTLSSVTTNKTKITYTKTDNTETQQAKTREPIVFEHRKTTDEKDTKSVQNKKRSVLERLGTKSSENIVSLSANRRMEQAIYVPAFRRAENQVKQREERERSPIRSERRNLSRDESHESRSRDPRSSRDREERTDRETRVMDLRHKVRDRELDRSTRLRNQNTGKTEEKTISSRSTITNRIGSRVIVAPPKPDYNEDDIGVPINSVVKVQPRPVIPKSKQASKNLLLRAVAEAQKSTANLKPREFKPTTPPRTRELYTKSFRANSKNTPKDNIIVEVDTIKLDNDDDDSEQQEDEEYVPTSESMDDESYLYVPQVINNNTAESSLKSGSEQSRTQFVVTLDSHDFRGKKSSPAFKSNVTAIADKGKRIQSDKLKNDRVQSPISIEINQKVNKLIIKNDTEDEEELHKEVTSVVTTLRRKRTPIRFDVDEEPKHKRSKSSDRIGTANNKHSAKESEDERGNRSRSRDRERSGERERSREGDSKGDIDSHKIKTSKSSSTKKYENLPPLPSAIAVATNDNKPKKERCKFYPSCSKGDRCEFVHPSTPCKSFPNCKFGDLCLYIHPKCKFDLTCSRLGCNYSHTQVASAAPPLSSHVVPVSNYKKIVSMALPMLCKFYPNCSNTLCEFYHPKPCKFGKNCTNKVECNFYHYDLPAMPSKNKLKWVASAV